MSKADSLPLIRSLIVAAQELRVGGSTGLHGAARLCAKLIVGKLIGDLSAFDFEAAITLADLTIESVTFPRSQILYQSQNEPDRLEVLAKRWGDSPHPARLDIVAQAFCFSREVKKGLETLMRAKQHLETDRTRCYSGARGDYDVRTYSGVLADVYLARLARSLSRIDLDAAFEWSDEIQSPVVKLGCQICCLNEARTDPAKIRRHMARVAGEVNESCRLAEQVSIPGFEVQTLACTSPYPDFPAERWEDLTVQNLPTAQEALAKVELRCCQGNSAA